MAFRADVPVLLASTTLASDAASYTFSSIPQTYNHLEIVYMARSSATTGGSYDVLGYQFNGDTTSNYRASTSTALISTPWIGLLANTTTLYATQPSVGNTRFFYYADTSSGWQKGLLIYTTRKVDHLHHLHSPRRGD